MSTFGVNDHHQATILNYMRFARYQRGQRLRAVDACFEDLKNSRLTEETFTADEVEDLLDGLLSVVRGEVDLELINTAHTNVLLLRQLFQQAEKWHLKLQADISELENRELLEQIKDFEEQEFAGAARDKNFKIASVAKLEPLNESGSSGLLNMEIERMKEENERLKMKLKQTEAHMIQIQDSKSALQSDLHNYQDELSGLKSKKPMVDTDEVNSLRRQMTGLQSDIQKSESMRNARESEMTHDLQDTKHELLRVQEMLEMAEKELEKKVGQTAPFRNLKQMLAKKNDQIKELRRELSKYES